MAPKAKFTREEFAILSGFSVSICKSIKKIPGFVDGTFDRDVTFRALVSRQMEMHLNERKSKREIHMVLLSQVWWKNTDADTNTYGVGGFFTILPKCKYTCVIRLEWENARNQNARRLDTE